MEEEKIDVVGAETSQALIDRRFFFIDRGPELGDEEDLFSGNTAFFDPAAGAGFVHIAVCGIDKTYTALILVHVIDCRRQSIT